MQRASLPRAAPTCCRLVGVGPISSASCMASTSGPDAEQPRPRAACRLPRKAQQGWRRVHREPLCAIVAAHEVRAGAPWVTHGGAARGAGVLLALAEQANQAEQAQHGRAGPALAAHLSHSCLQTGPPAGRQQRRRSPRRGPARPQHPAGTCHAEQGAAAARGAEPGEGCPCSTHKHLKGWERAGAAARGPPCSSTTLGGDCCVRPANATTSRRLSHPPDVIRHEGEPGCDCSVAH